jgi:hypothetical protein
MNTSVVPFSRRLYASRDNLIAVLCMDHSCSTDVLQEELKSAAQQRTMQEELKPAAQQRTMRMACLDSVHSSDAAASSK